MAENNKKAEFDESVSSSRASAIRDAGLKKAVNKDPQKAAASKVAGDKITQELTGPASIIRSLVFQGIVPLVGIGQALAAFGMWWSMKLAGNKLSGGKSKIGIGIGMGVWAAVFIQFASVMVTLVILYILVNPVDFAIDLSI